MKIAVIGVGGTGSAALRFLARSGHEVHGFEQFEVGHDRGSSHGQSRIIRYTYPDNLYTAMMGDAYPLWDSLEQDAAEELFVRCGGVYFGTANHPNILAVMDALRENDLPFDLLGPQDAQKRAPALRFNPGEVAIFQKESGFLRASRCVRANARLAVTAGAHLHENIFVEEVRQEDDKVIVRTAEGEQTFDTAIVTAGPWMTRLINDLDLPLTVTRQEIVYLSIARNSQYFEPGTLPVWISADDYYYGFPSDGVLDGVKLAAYQSGHVTDPDHVRRERDTSLIEKVIAVAAQRLPDLAPEVLSSQTCLYTSTPDEDFIIDHLPHAPAIWMVSGCSGHGFKFTVLLGHIAAQLATNDYHGRDLSRFALKRFALRH